ncbi:hypothetical protein RJT34_16154 [Clitoria ternatea]|uniref:Uncharacterized protein n=1 Tax=Clitoria ternatea TaxID=43366 RepID=A0AAN9J7Y7_CLITE
MEKKVVGDNGGISFICGGVGQHGSTIFVTWFLFLFLLAVKSICEVHTGVAIIYNVVMLGRRLCLVLLREITKEDEEVEDDTTSAKVRDLALEGVSHQLLRRRCVGLQQSQLKMSCDDVA